MKCVQNQTDGNLWASARSQHTGGVQAAMIDGSVRFISDNINLLVWQSVCTRAGKETVGEF
jgi:prepilin-type processing-associated H-X9-DG protein